MIKSLLILLLRKHASLRVFKIVANFEHDFMHKMDSFGHNNFENHFILSLVLVYVAVGLLTLVIGIVETVIFYQNKNDELWPIWYFNLGGFRTPLKPTVVI